ncbi:hypothetical protein ACQKDD_00995 [Planococcus kocurii]|uniref:hypothetical protein n=1 Tax=Planococcus kocurii TaxID=1374 RepID=UPI003D05F4CC
MIRILLFIIFAASTLSILYFFTKGDIRKNRIILLGGGIFVAAIGLFMQSTFSLILSIAGILGVSLLVALSYTKFLEKEQLKNQQLIQERRNKKSSTPLKQPKHVEPIQQSVHEPIVEKSFGMQTIAVIKEEQKVE